VRVLMVVAERDAEGCRRCRGLHGASLPRAVGWAGGCFSPARCTWRAAGRGRRWRRQWRRSRRQGGAPPRRARALMMERKSYPAGMRCLPSWLRTWGPLSSKASRSLTA
jgi:hypothetical protein